MPNKKPNLQAGETSGSGGDSTMVPTEDRLSSLPDELLHRIMSFLRAWEVARTCVLSRRWRHLWASVPCVDIRVRQLNHHQQPPEQLSSFVYHFLLEREETVPLDTLRLISSQLSPHPMAEVIPSFKHVNMISCHLKHVKLSGFSLGDRTLKQLSYQCPSLEVLDLKKCCLRGKVISSMSLKSLAIIECRIMENLSIAAPNLVSLYCITPHHRAPLFESLGSITTATIVLDDSVLYVGYENEYDDIFWQKNEYKDLNDNATYGGSDSDSDSSFRDDMDYGTHADSDRDASTCEYTEIVNDEHKQHSDCTEGCNHGLYHGYHSYHSNYTVDHSKILGGHNVIHSLVNATSLKLLADAGEIILSRELKACPMFMNLKTLSLGEWSMADDFSPLVFFLQHTPNLESLFLELKLDCGCRKTTEDMARPEERSFGCANLKMVKIKCCKHDPRVHLLAQLFMANGVPVEKIYVHRSLCHFKA